MTPEPRVKLAQVRFVSTAIEPIATFYAALLGVWVPLNEHYFEMPAGAASVGFSRVGFTEDRGPQPPAGDVRVVMLAGWLHPAGHGSVRISYPESVTAIMCSNCAVHRRSLVTTVQPSDHMSCR